MLTWRHVLFYPRVVLLNKLLLQLLTVLVVVELLSPCGLLGFRHVCGFILLLFPRQDGAPVLARR